MINETKEKEANGEEEWQKKGEQKKIKKIMIKNVIIKEKLSWRR